MVTLIAWCTSSIPRDDVVFSQLLYSNARCSQACHLWSQVLPWLSLDFQYAHRVVTSAPRYTWRPMHLSSQLWDLTTLGFWSDIFQTLPESRGDKNTFGWYLTWTQICSDWCPGHCPVHCTGLCSCWYMFLVSAITLAVEYFLCICADLLG